VKGDQMSGVGLYYARTTPRGRMKLRYCFVADLCRNCELCMIPICLSSHVFGSVTRTLLLKIPLHMRSSFYMRVNACSARLERSIRSTRAMCSAGCEEPRWYCKVESAKRAGAPRRYGDAYLMIGSGQLPVGGCFEEIGTEEGSGPLERENEQQQQQQGGRAAGGGALLGH
jgi:hypothetical protein